MADSRRWHQLSIDETASLTGTDLSTGRTAADMTGRTGKKYGNNVFRPAHSGFPECFLAVVSDAALPVLVVAALVALFIGNRYEAAAILGVLCLSCLAGALLRYASRSKCEQMSAGMLPRAHIITDGKRSTVDCRGLTVGDLIVLRTGDVVPADARLVYTSSFSVLEHYTDSSDGQRKLRRINKDADIVYPRDSEAESYDNMVYAGTTVAAGSCRAIVTAIGDSARASLLYGGIQLTTKKVFPAYFDRFRNRVRLFNIITLVAALPLTFIGTLTIGASADTGMLDILLIMLSLAVATFGEMSVSASEYVISATLKGKKCRITQPAAAERIAKTDTVLILSEAVLCDTSEEVRAAYYGGKIYLDANTQSGELIGLAECAELMNSACAGKERGQGVSAEQTAAFTRYSSAMNISRMGILSGVSGMTYKTGLPFAGCESAVIEKEITDNPSAARQIVFRSENTELIRGCRKYRTADGDLGALKPDILSGILESHRKLASRCGRLYLFATMTSAQTGMVFEGMILIGPSFPEANKELTERCRSAGYDILLVLPEGGAHSAAYAGMCGLADKNHGIALAGTYSENNRRITDGIGSCSVFIGFGADGTRELVEGLEAAGRQIIPVLNSAAELRCIPRGVPVCSVNGVSDDAAGVVSHIRIDPADSETDTSGLEGVAEAINCSRAAGEKFTTLKKYLTVSAVIRAAAVLFTVVFGQTYAVPSALSILAAGLLVDYSAMFSSVYSGTGTRMRKVKSDNVGNGERIPDYLFCSVVGLLPAVFICAAGAFLNSRMPAESPASGIFTVLTLLFSEYGIMFVSERGFNKYGKRTFNPMPVLFALFALSLTVICAAVYTGDISAVAGVLPYCIPASIAVSAITSGAFLLSGKVKIGK